LPDNATFYVAVVSSIIATNGMGCWFEMLWDRRDREIERACSLL
jgi:hypothetical protein